ncbi:Uncharacterised protein [Rothia kristinae]|nr:Uncharacterised protein [Rothia kristinae]
MTPSATPTRGERLRSAGRSGPSRYRLVAGSAVLGLAVSLLCAVWAPQASAVATVVMVLVIAWGWPAASGVAQQRGGEVVPVHTGIIGASGLAACAVVLLTASASLVTLLPAVVAVGVLACFIGELVRGRGRPPGWSP